MFFTPELLCNTGGKFAVIWLAAMKKNKLKKKDFENVDLPMVCRELEKLLAPKWAGRMSSVEGFSLRLSAQLVHGISIVYNMKVTFLYKDTNLSFQNLHRHNCLFESIDQALLLGPDETVVAKTTAADRKNKNRDRQQVNEEFLTVIDPLFGQPQLFDNDAAVNFNMSHHHHQEVPLPEPVLNEDSFHRNVVRDLSTITMKEAGDFLLQPDELDMKLAHQEEAGLDHQVRTSEELNLLMMPEHDLSDLHATGLFGLQQLQNEENNLQTPKASDARAKTPDRPSKRRSSKSEAEILAKEADDNKVAADDPAIVVEPPAEAIAEGVPDPKVDELTVPAKHQEKEEDRLILGPAPSSEQRRKITTKARVSAKSKLIIDKQIIISSDQMKNNILATTVEPDQTQLSAPLHLPSANQLMALPSHLWPVHRPNKNLHFHQKGCRDDREIEAIPYMETFTRNCKYLSARDQVQADKEEAEALAAAAEIEENLNRLDLEANLNADANLELLEGQVAAVASGLEREAERAGGGEILGLNDRTTATVGPHEESVDVERHEKSSVLNPHSRHHSSRISNLSTNLDKHSRMKQSFDDPSFSKSTLEKSASKAFDTSDKTMPAENVNKDEHLVPPFPDFEAELMRGEAPELKLEDEQLIRRMLLPASDLQEKIQSEVLSGNGELKFSSLAPPRVTIRSEAAKSFYTLLTMAKFERVRLVQRQDVKFADIEIIPSESFIMD